MLWPQLDLTGLDLNANTQHINRHDSALIICFLKPMNGCVTSAVKKIRLRVAIERMVCNNRLILNVLF